MVEIAKSWIENSTLVCFLIGQLIVIGGAGASTLAYFTRLETGHDHGGTRRGLHREPYG
jgi:hypothetical protein